MVEFETVKLNNGVELNGVTFKSIKELLQLAKNTPITTDQIRQIRARLEKQGKQEAETSATNSNGLLSRTYNL